MRQNVDNVLSRKEPQGQSMTLISIYMSSMMIILYNKEEPFP